ncbi:hypothetical protein QL285_033025 [Trifolium repens]|nr:hypothetical protein QL285_033025 [Trifolium repens]
MSSTAASDASKFMTENQVPVLRTLFKYLLSSSDRVRLIQVTDIWKNNLRCLLNRSSPLSVDIEEHLEDLEKLEEELAPIPQLNEGLSDIESD